MSIVQGPEAARRRDVEALLEARGAGRGALLSASARLGQLWFPGEQLHGLCQNIHKSCIEPSSP